MSVHGRLREGFFAGEVWSIDRFTAEFPDTGKSTFSQLVSNMRDMGYRFETQPLYPESADRREKQKLAYRLTDYRPTEAEIAAGKNRYKANKAKVKTAAATTTDLGPLPDPATLPSVPPTTHRIIRDDPLSTPCPDFGSHLRVVLLSEADNGVMTVGLRNGKTTYVAELVGIHTGE